MMNWELTKEFFSVRFVVICLIILVIIFVIVYISRLKKDTSRDKISKRQKKDEYDGEDFIEEDDESTIFMGDISSPLNIRLVSDMTGDTFSALCFDQIIIGRKAECEIQIQGDKSVSGRHCLFKKVNGEILMVMDMNSSNGTYLNHNRVVSEEYVSDGDTLEIGRNQYTIRIN